MKIEAKINDNITVCGNRGNERKLTSQAIYCPFNRTIYTQTKPLNDLKITLQ